MLRNENRVGMHASKIIRIYIMEQTNKYISIKYIFHYYILLL